MSTFDVPDLIDRPPQDTGCNTVRDVIDGAALKRSHDSFLISPHTKQTLTFDALRHQARKITFELQQSGLVRGDKVAFLMDNGVFTAEVFLGTMYGGFVAVPLNVGAGESQLCYTLDHSEAKAVYVSQEYASLLQSLIPKVPQAIRIITADVDGVSQNAQENVGSIDLPVLSPEDPALLMYTSGSTGQPKAAVHSHRSILAHGRNSIESHQLTASDRSLLVLPLYHINAECVTLVPTLMSGGAVVIPHRFNVSQFWDWLDEYACTWSAVVPTIVSQLLDWKDPRAGQRETAFKRIRFLRSSSAPLAPSLHQEFLDRFNLLLIQAMGCSEGGNVFSNPLPPRANKIGSPGLPWGFETKIIDRQGNELPTGEPGEVLLRGAGLAQGYYKDAPATAAAFDADGWLHTGDLAYRDEDGYFFVVGRSKELIIKGGVNIAPRQIDDVLESHPAVLEAAAIGVPDHYLGEDVVAFVVLRTGVSCDGKNLLSFCEERLGLFKTPTRIYFVPDLPKGPSGKVQRLRLSENAAQISTTKARGPATEFDTVDEKERASANTQLSTIEAIVTEVWEKVLSQPKLDHDSNFFELGGHSLLAVKCVSLLRERISTPLSLSDFFENATIAHQAALMKRRLDLGPESGPVRESASNPEQSFEHLSSSVSPAAISPRDRKLPCPLTSAQRRVWFFEQMDPGQPLYNEAEAVRLVGELNVDMLERALNVIVDRHETLRSTIEMDGDQPVVVVHDSWPLRIKRIDVSTLPPAQRDREVDRLLVDDPREPYHLESEPGIRVTLIRLAPKEHVLILMMHHIICDWSSEGVLWRELSSLYSSLLRGETPALPPLPIQHGDYAAWQVQHDTDAAFSEDLDFWEETLRGAPPLLDLPADRVRPPVLSYRGKRQRFVLKAELTQELRMLSQRAQTTLFSVFAAALNTLLYRYTGQSDISLGIPIADRDRTEMQSMMGFLLHTQVLRTQLREDMTFRELLGRVQKGTLDLYLHRAVPFDQVVRRVQPERNPAYATLFQVMLNWRDRDQLLSYIGLEGLAVESLIADARTAKFDLTLFATDCGDEILLEAEYNTDLFDDDRIARMFGHYQALLGQFAANAEQRLRDPHLLSDSEKHQLVVDFNATEQSYPLEKSLAALIEEQVERTPDAVAIVFEDLSLTYRGLNERANQIAHELRKRGAGPDELVGVFLDRSVEMIVALLAVVKAGAAYVPLDPDLPAARLSCMIEDSGMRILLTQRDVTHLPQFAGITIDVDGREWHSNSHENANVQVGPENLAYVIYTSGSTGKPKGVEVPRRALMNLLWSMNDWLKLQTGQAVLGATTISFDIAGMEIWLPLLVGARIILVSRDTARNGEDLSATLGDCDVRLAQATPTTWRTLLSAGWTGKPDLVAICTGEAMPYELAQQLGPLVRVLWNLYGPTETTIWSTGCTVESGEKRVLIGRPIANTECYILDGGQNLLPVGVVGELYIGGEGLAHGYRKQPELTKQKFVANPFVPGKRMYRTGDLARYRANGMIECLGRTDHQVKIRGYRIELGEIESVLRGHPSVSEAAVIVREGRGKELVGYVVPADSARYVKTELRDYLKEKLPGYMVPTTWVRMDSLPLTSNGKLDRSALPVPSDIVHTSDEYEGPRGETEIRLVQVWEQLLSVRRIGREDNFFDLGGDSMLAVRLSSMAKKAWNIALPLAIVFQSPTVQEMAAFLDGKIAPKYSPRVALLKATGTRSPFLCVDAGPFFRPLAQRLRPDQPFLGLRLADTSELPVHFCLEDIAEYHLGTIREVQPKGPYYLGGWCLSGLVAYEIARRLREAGDQVNLLVLFDVTNITNLRRPSGWESLRRAVSVQTWKLKHGLSALTKLRLNEKWNHIRAFAARRYLYLQRKFWLLCDRLQSRVSRRILIAPREPSQAVFVTSRRYHPQPYDGRVVLFRSAAQAEGPYHDTELSWKGVIADLDVCDMPGDHNEMFLEPFVSLLADQLELKLSGAPARGDQETSKDTKNRLEIKADLAAL